MNDYTFVDALTGDEVSLDYATGDARVRKGAGPEKECTSLFFPGCSFLNYAMPLVSAVYDTLHAAGAVDGISVLCCGKILMYEPDGANLRASFEDQLRDHLAASSIKRIVAACPNCVKALRAAFGEDERTAGIEVVPLPVVLADLGYRLDRGTVAALIKGDAQADVLLCPKDSCPDRDTGEFAEGLRRIIGEGLYADPKNNRSRSLCCGSLANAAGKYEAGVKLANRNGEQALDAHADAIVTACMSCAFQLTVAQNHVSAVHFLELLYNWRINWAAVGGLMKLRFLFDDTLGAIVEEGSGRAFAGLGGTEEDAE